MTNISSIKIRSFTGSVHGVSTFTDTEISDQFIEQVKITQHKHEEMDTAEIVFKASVPKIVKVNSNVSINNEPFNWLIQNASFSLDDPATGIYTITLQLVEYTFRLTKQFTPNLSFNQLVDSGATLYRDLYEVVDRVNKLSPTEKPENWSKTRIIDLDENNNTMVSDKLRTILEDVTDVKEFNFTGRNMYEVYSEIFSLIGGVPRLYRDSTNKTFIDIELYTDGLSNVVNINNFFGYEGMQQSGNYATRAVIEQSSIIDQDSNYVHGLDNGRLVQATNYALVDDDMVIKLETPIYRLIKAEIKRVGTTTWYDMTDHVVNSQLYQNLPVTRGSSSEVTKQNSVQWDIAGSEIYGWGEEVRGNTPVFSESKFVYLWNDVTPSNIGDIGNLRNIVVRVEYQSITEDNKIILTQQNLDDDNQIADVRINSGERVNEMNRIINTSLNKLERFGQKQITKKVRHNDGTDIYPLGSYDTDSELYVSSIEVLYGKNETTATYLLASEVNILSEYVGVNAENRPYDIVIGGALVRQEQYEDWCLVRLNPFPGEPDQITDPDFAINESSINEDFIEILGNWITGSSVGNHYNQILTYSEDIPQRSILAPEIKVGRNMINWELPIATQLYVGSKIIDSSTITGVEQDMEIGQPYVDGNGQLEDIAFALTEGVNELNSQDDLRQLPDATLYYDLVQGNPLWDVGDSTFILRDIPQVWNPTNDNLDGGSPIEYGSATFIPTSAINPTGVVQTLNTISAELGNEYRITSARFPYRGEFGDTTPNFNPEMAISVTSGSANGTTEIRIRLINQLGFEVYLSDWTTLATLSVIGNTAGGIDFDSREFNDIEFTFDQEYVVSKIEIDVRVTNRHTQTAQVTTARSITRFTAGWMVVNEIRYELSEGETIYVDKNPTELLRPSYQLNFQSMLKDVIIGESLTTQSPFLNNGMSGWDSVIIVENDIPYTIRDVNKTTGTEIEGAVVRPSFGSGIYGICNIYCNDLNGGEHVGIIGIKNGKRYLLFAWNNNEFNRAGISFTFKHFNPKLVYKW